MGAQTAHAGVKSIVRMCACCDSGTARRPPGPRNTAASPHRRAHARCLKQASNSSAQIGVEPALPILSQAALTLQGIELCRRPSHNMRAHTAASPQGPAGEQPARTGGPRARSRHWQNAVGAKIRKTRARRYGWTRQRRGARVRGPPAQRAGGV
ncbi:MAG: hypothetical protein J3K34DRAFT_408887 [Monoraphidium minutum]|nr:MAG: hypothetical protein J3K34DRAFT_408887 [Monoraphidium minutum]